MQTLLRKTHAYRLLERETKEGKGSHAYLLLFDDGKNLREGLKTFAKLLLRLDDAQEGESLRKARLVDSESFSDCLIFPKNSEKLTVEDADAVKEECLLRPVEGEKKVLVLCHFETANAATQNKLLKLLEEPPTGVVFLLGATNAYPVLQTVLSRSKTLEIGAFSPKDLEECLLRLYGEKYQRETLALAAAASGGSLGEAQAVLEGGYFQALTEHAFSLALAQPHQLPAAVKKVGETKHAKELFSLLRLIYRDALVIKTQGERGNRHLLFRRAEVREVEKKYSARALLFAQDALSQAEAETTFNAVFPQCLELCLARILRENQRTWRE